MQLLKERTTFPRGFKARGSYPEHAILFPLHIPNWGFRKGIRQVSLDLPILNQDVHYDYWRPRGLEKNSLAEASHWHSFIFIFNHEVFS